jgi:hypothetical protein
MKNRFKGIMVTILFVTFLSSVSSAVSGEIYKWKDKDGNIVFSDTPPPPGVNAEKKEFKEESTERLKTKHRFSQSTNRHINITWATVRFIQNGVSILHG